LSLRIFSIWSCVSKTIWIADAHRDNAKRFVVRTDEKLTAFVELEAAINRLPQDEILKPCNAAALLTVQP
jgi:hypothetical protein